MPETMKPAFVSEFGKPRWGCAEWARSASGRNGMLHFYDGYHFLAMHLLWWVLWIPFISVLFGAYEPVRRTKRGMSE